MITFARIETAIGHVLVAGSGGTITHLRLPDDTGLQAPDPDWRESPDDWRDAAAQIADYLAGKRDDFDLPLAPKGTDFQQRVWRALQAIPRGQTRSYGDIARKIGQPGAMRAVGLANGRNPIPLIIPCHRVIAADGSLGGFSGSLAVKRRLLEIEGAHAHTPRLL